MNKLTIIFVSSLASSEVNDPTDTLLHEQLEMLYKACENGNSKSCGFIGLDYYIIKNYSKSFEFNEKACCGNEPSGCESIASMYEEGLGVTRNYSKALVFYKKACDYNLAIGCIGIGAMYKNGKGIQQDMSQAKTYYEKACQLKNPYACKTANLISDLLSK